MKINTIIWIFIVLLLIFFSQKRKILINVSNDEKIILKYPITYLGVLNIWTNHQCKILRSSKNRQDIIEARLLLTAFDEPIMIFVDDTKQFLYCLYAFDISYHLLIFDLTSNFEVLDDKNLKSIVISTKWKVWEATNNEIEYFIKKINKMEDDELRKIMIPSWGFGFFRIYRDNTDIINVINKMMKK
jgi:hypothetical protein